MAHLRTVLPLALASLALSWTRTVSACHPRTVCLYWETEIVDDDFGIALGEKIPARGTKVVLIPPAPEPPLSTFLDQEGCLTFDTQYAFGHKMMVYNEAWIGNVDPPEALPVRLRVTRQTADDPMAVQQDFHWPVDLHGLAPNDVVPVTIPLDKTHPIPPLMALGTAVLHRFHELDVLPPPPAVLEIRYQDWQGNARGWCNLIQVGPDSFREKFLVAHEMGHWLQCEWGGGFGDFLLSDYNYGEMGQPQVPAAACQFGVVGIPDPMNPGMDLLSDANSHGIRSAEWSTPAMREGFAHFIASVVFNDTTEEDGVFRYYKDIDVLTFGSYADFVDPTKDNLRVSLLGAPACDPAPCDPSPAWGGENRWTESHCPADWAVDAVSTEMDWMRFFWHFLTRPGDDPPTLRQILEFFAYVVTQGGVYPIDQINVFPQLKTLMGISPEMSDFVGRFDQANCDVGVYNADTCPP